MYLFASSDGTVRNAVRTNCTTRGGNIGGVYGTTLAVLGVDTIRTSNVSTSSNNTTLIVRVSTCVLPGALSVMVRRNTGSSDECRVRTVVPGPYESMG